MKTEERVLYGRSRDRQRLSFDEAVRRAEAELRAETDQLNSASRQPVAEAAQLEASCAPSVGHFSPKERGRGVVSNSSSSVQENLPDYDDDFEQDTEIRTES